MEEFKIEYERYSICADRWLSGNFTTYDYKKALEMLDNDNKYQYRNVKAFQKVENEWVIIT